MKILAAKQAYSAQMQTLQTQRRQLRKTLQEQQESGNPGRFDTVELTRELSLLDAQYEATREGMESIVSRENMIHDAEAARQQGEAAKESYAELAKMMEVYRRIASGARVPAKDEQKLLEFSSELYMTAKNMALLAERSDKEYDSLWEDEKAEEKQASPREVAENSEISVASPESVAADAAASFQSSPPMDAQV